METPTDGPAAPAAPAPQAAPAAYTVQIPSDLEYIPPLRQFIADLARVEGYSKKFCFRTEIIVDELVTNGILHGSQDVHTSILVSAAFDAEALQLSVQDQGGSRQNLENLKRAVHSPRPSADKKRGRGLKIVQMLSSEINIDLAENGNTSVRVVKVKDEDPAQREKLLYESDL